MIELRGVTKTYLAETEPVCALRNVSLRIPEGSVFGVIGLSGAGKSTLIRCINRLETPAGQVLIDGRDITRLTPAELRQERRRIGMIFQHFNLLSSRTVAGNVAFPLEIAGAGRAETARRVAELLELVGLADKAGVYPAQLSGGQKQRVGIARALANHPRVLLSDEATSALDPQTTKSILRLLKDINQRMNLTIVLITHEMAVIKEICDLVAVLEDGAIVETGPVTEVFANPRTEVARSLLSGITGHDVPEAVMNRANGGARAC